VSEYSAAVVVVVAAAFRLRYFDIRSSPSRLDSIRLGSNRTTAPLRRQQSSDSAHFQHVYSSPSFD